MYVVIMCGGQGKRFWPKSRESFPKQFLKIAGDRSLLSETFARVRKLVPATHIFVVTHQKFAKLVKRDIPALPSKNIIAEPDSKNTAPCMAYSLFYLKRFFKDEPVLFLPADHLIKEPDKFRESVHSGLRRIEKGSGAIIFGIKPRYPETGYGYIKKSGTLALAGEEKIFRVSEFKEKPEKWLAQEFVKSGQYLWNSGMFLFRMDKLEDGFKRHLPAMHRAFSLFDFGKMQRVGVAKGIEKLYSSLESVSIDHGLAEKESDFEVVESDFSWNDLGNWRALEEIWPKDASRNSVKGLSYLKNSKGLIADPGGKLLVSLGVEDIVLVETKDVIFICRKDSLDELKSLLEEMKENGLGKYL